MDVKKRKATSDNLLGLSLLPSKAPKLTLTSCLCHVRPVAERLTPFSFQSWSTLLHAATIRQDDLFSFFRVAHPSKPQGVYPRSCYQTYANKKSLAKFETARDQLAPDHDVDDCNEVDDNENAYDNHATEAPLQKSTGRLTRSKVAQPPPGKTACLFCQQEWKKVSGKRQNLSACVSFEACGAIHNAAMIRNDDCVLLGVNPG